MNRNLTVLLLLASWSLTLDGATFCVSTAADLHAALTAAQTNGQNDVIQLVQGTYAGNVVYDTEEPAQLALEGGYLPGCASRVVDPANTVLDGMALGTVFKLNASAASLTVDGLTIRNGNGGGLGVRANRVTISHSAIQNNFASSSGAGIYMSTSGLATISDSVIANNASIGAFGAMGGLMVELGSAPVTIRRTTIANNVGGGADIPLGTVVDCTITGIDLSKWVLKEVLSWRTDTAPVVFQRCC